ncbi:hypothetical protein [Pseudomonas sp. NPDC096950]|uniref:hypothetical protein n=1 Tax=Pseudomonas sp. NPDC096950 TaxID=3364485 RepID=UPI00383A26DC
MNDGHKVMARIDALFSGAVEDPQIPISVALINQLADRKEKGFDWLLAESKKLAKAIRLEIAVELAIFTFKDDSQLVLLQTGECYAVASSSEFCNEKIVAWLRSLGIAIKSEAQTTAE